MNYDIILLKSINNLSTYSPVLNMLGVFLASYSQYVIAAIAAVLLFFPKADRRHNRVMISLSLVSALVARLIVKTLLLFAYARPRPYLVVSEVHKLIPTFSYEDYQSFPSGHAIFFFAFATTIFMFNKKLGAWCYLIAVAMGLARVFVGVHWPSDILGGAVLGIIVGWLVNTYYSTRKAAIDSAVAKLFIILHL